MNKNDGTHALKNPKELFCREIQRLSNIGKSMRIDDKLALATSVDQKALSRNHKLWRVFQNTIQSNLKKEAINGKDQFDVPLEFFPVREKINAWAIEHGFNVKVTANKEFNSIDETFEYLNSLFEDAILEKKVYFLMTIDWTLNNA